MFNGFLVVKLSEMDSRSETRQYFLQQRDNIEIPVKKKNMYRDRMLEQFESQKVTIEGRDGPEGIEYDTITLRTIGTVPPVAPTGNPITISPGSLNSDVVLLQNRLKELGYDLAADGFFGDKTVEFVKKFQEAHHLNADGVVNPETWEALMAA
jgi:murein L,D-transpeptidase YcbB/YkuD